MAKSKKKKSGGKSRILLPVGRPRAFDTAEEFKEHCIAYFKALKFWNMPSISGLCAFLNISRETFYDYGKTKGDDFKEVVRNVRYIIESAWVDRLPKPGAIGAIFYLKNFDPANWKDRAAGESEDNPLYTKQITGIRVVKDRQK